jgi:hypothetical protein
MKSQDLELLGRAMFPSPNWKSRLAGILGVSKPTILRWLDERDYDMPSKYHAKLMALADEHLKNYKMVLDRLSHYRDG